MSTASIKLPFLQDNAFTRAGRRISLAVRDKKELAVMIVCVRNVERLCASIGHVETGRLLDEFDRRLREIVQEKDSMERIGDRKFVVLLNGLRNRGHVSLAAKKIERLGRQTAANHDEQVDLTTTVGIALCPSQGEQAHELLRFAEIASLAGARKRESVCFYEDEAARQLFTDWGLEKRLDSALQCGDLELHYQPKLCLRTGEIMGAEALMRWRDPEIGQISPEVFIDLAESTGQIVELTQFAVQNASRQLCEWRRLWPKLCVAVNITPSMIQSQEIVDVLQNATSIWGIPNNALTLEVTENALMEDRESSQDILIRLRETGARVSIDDFGTGYSSLAYLKDIPADELKIDRSFVMGMLNDDGDYKIVQHTIGIGKSFGLDIVAEGVESETMLRELHKLGCDYAQGYHICRPIPAPEFAAFCRDRTTRADLARDKQSGGAE